MPLNFHLSCWILVPRIKVTHRAHFVFRLVVSTHFVCSVFGGIFGNVVYSALVPIFHQQRTMDDTLDFELIRLWVPHQQRRGFPIQGIRGIRVTKKLRQEDFEDVDHVEHW